MASIKRVETSEGARWRVRWYVGGRQVERWVDNEAAAEAIAVRSKQDKLEGVAFNPQPSRQKLDEFFAEWLQSRVVKGRPLRESTKLGYRNLWRRHMAKTIGGHQLRGLTPKVVREWYDGVAKTAGRDQAAKAYRLLRAVLNTAVSDDVIRQSPCRIKGAGQEHHDERPMPETRLVLELAAAIGDRYRPIPLLAGFAALRTGEMLGLRRSDVNLLHAHVSVVAQSQELEGGQQFVEWTKSDAGRRVVHLPQLLVDALDEHLAAFVGPAVDAPLFTSPRGGPLRRARLSKVWTAAKAATGAPENLRLHDLRHHGATMTARMPGVTLKELMARIGHSSMAAALRYQHATTERDKQIASFLDDVIAEAAGDA